VIDHTLNIWLITFFNAKQIVYTICFALKKVISHILSVWSITLVEFIL
jgi:hypothetical protein